MTQPIQAVQIYYEHPFGAEREVLREFFSFANNANLYYQKTALLIGNNKRCLTKAYDIVSSPHFRLSDL